MQRMPCSVDFAMSGSSFSANGAGKPPAAFWRNAMTVTIRQLHPHFVGEVSGVDLRKPLTPQEAPEIEAGMDKYAVLLFRDQDMTDEQQLAFALNFGERENRARRQRRQATGFAAHDRAERRLQSRQGRQAAAARHRVAPVQSRQLPVAFRQLVPPDPGEIFAAVGAGGEPEGRQHRIRRHARGL